MDTEKIIYDAAKDSTIIWSGACIAICPGWRTT